MKEVGENEGYEELNKTAEVMVNLFRSDADSDVHVAYGTIVGEIKEVSRSYKEARMALDVGKIFLRKRCHRLLHTWNRTSDLSAPDPAVQDVHQGDL